MQFRGSGWTPSLYNPLIKTLFFMCGKYRIKSEQMKMRSHPGHTTNTTQLTTAAGMEPLPNIHTTADI